MSHVPKEADVQNFSDFLNTTKTADMNKKEEFSKMVDDGLEILGIPLQEAGIMFRTAPGTVSRWKNGHTAPPLVSRIAIKTMLTARVRGIIRAPGSH